jgi:pimeloyl-ACP methyl ester carboxylesterase
MVPGSIAAELASIAAPVFVAVGDNDIAGPPHLIGGAFERCREFTLYVLPASGHNHNVAPTRALLWDRVADWVDAQVTTRSRSAPRAG